MSRAEYYGGPDWWGRFISFGSLLVALAAVYFVWDLRQQALSREEQMNQFNAGLDQWQQLANDEITAIRTEGERAIQEERTRLNELYADLDRRATTPSDRGLRMAGRPQSSDGTGDTHGVGPGSVDSSLDDPNGLFAQDSNDGDADEAEPGTFEMEDEGVIEAPQEDPAEDGAQVAGEKPSLPLAMGPKLMVVRRAMRVTGDQLNRAIISNSGSEAIKITQVYFVPSEDVPIPNALRDRPETADSVQDDIARIAFGRTDNSSSIAGAHGAYRREFLEPLLILPGDELEIDLEIANRDHRGWGLLGELTLVGEGDELTLEQVTAVFRDVSDG